MKCEGWLRGAGDEYHRIRRENEALRGGQHPPSPHRLNAYQGNKIIKNFDALNRDRTFCFFVKIQKLSKNDENTKNNLEHRKKFFDVISIRFGRFCHVF